MSGKRTVTHKLSSKGKGSTCGKPLARIQRRHSRDWAAVTCSACLQRKAQHEASCDHPETVPYDCGCNPWRRERDCCAKLSRCMRCKRLLSRKANTSAAPHVGRYAKR